MNSEKVFCAAVARLFFDLAPLLTIPIYLYLFVKNRYNFSHPFSVFEVPVLFACKATVVSFSYFILNYSVLFLGYDTEGKIVTMVSNGMFYSSTFFITAANNILLPLICISCLYFFINTSGTIRHLFIWTISLIYIILKYLTIQQVLPNFLSFIFISNISSQTLVICPLDLFLVVISMILLVIRLSCSKQPISFEDLVLVFETIFVLFIKLFGLLSDMSAIGMFTLDPQTVIRMTSIDTERMLLKNYEFDQMILPYCFMVSILLVKMEDIRRRTTIRIYDQFDNTAPVKWIRFRRGTDPADQQPVDTANPA